MRSNWSLVGAMSDLTGRRQRRVIAELRGQIDAGSEAVRVARSAAIGALASSRARERVGDLESTGDAHRAELVRILAKTLVIPIDREDLFRLSRSVDDILDNLRDFCRELDLYGAQMPSPLFIPLLDPVGEALEELAVAVDALVGDPAAVTAHCLAAKKGHNTVRAAYQQAIAALFDGEVTTVAIKQRELLRRLDVVGLRMGESADALADGHLKRGG